MTSKSTFATVVAADLKQVERSLDTALGQAGLLLTTMTTGRMEAGFAACVGHTALSSLAEAIQNGVAMRGRVVQTHSRLAEAADTMGLSWTTSGPLEDKTGDGTTETGPIGLAIET